MCRWYKTKVEEELQDLCNDILKLLEGEGSKDQKDAEGNWAGGLIRSCQDKDSKVFYKKMRADYYRYLCEFNPPEKRKLYI